MASIQNVRLQIVENAGAAAALVTFRVTGSQQDVQQQRTYAEIVELIGVDARPREDGHDEPIPFGRSEGSVKFNVATLERTRLLALPAAGLDEDKAAGPIIVAGFGSPDEIRARVTLTSSVGADSDIVVLHEPLFQQNKALATPA